MDLHHDSTVQLEVPTSPNAKAAEGSLAATCSAVLPNKSRAAPVIAEWLSLLLKLSKLRVG